MSDWMDRYLDALNSHDGAQVAEMMAEDVTFEDVAMGVTHQGREAVKAFIAELDGFSSDASFSPISKQQTGNQYAIEWESSGTNTGDMAGIPATNRQYRVRGVSIGELDEHGKILRNRDYWNMADYLMQLGMFGVAPEAT